MTKRFAHWLFLIALVSSEASAGVKSCLLMSRTAELWQAVDLMAQAKPCNRDATGRFDRWTMALSAAHRVADRYEVSAGYSRETIYAAAPIKKESVWQQLAVQHSLAVGTGFGMIRLENRRHHEDYRLHLRTGLSRDANHIWKISVASTLIGRLHVNRVGDTSGFDELTATVSFATSLSEQLRMVLRYEYKYRFQDKTDPEHEAALNLVWADSGLELLKDLL